MFAGDMMFDRTIRSKAEEKGYDFIFSCIHDYLLGFDSVIANLEGPITDSPSQSAGTQPGQMNNTTFTFSPLVANALFNHRIRTVNLGNNHSLDFGSAGAQSTREYLSGAGIDFFGSPHASSSVRLSVRGLKIAFVNFNQFLGFNNPQQTVKDIISLRDSSDYVFVYTHWGEEYVAANEYQKELAYMFIDAGADMVIGSHPHVIQEHEVYKGKHIYYSLGNFMFDQYFSDEVKRGGGVEVLLSTEGITVHETDFELMRDGRTCLGKNQTY